MKKFIGLCVTVLAFSQCAPAGAAVAGENFFLPVVCAGALMGAYDKNGDWQKAPDTVTVDGKTVRLAEVEKDKTLMKRLKDGAEGVPCETPLIGEGQKLAYFGPDGRLGEGTVTGTSIRYMGEASGKAILEVAVEGFDGNWSDLIVGVADAVDAYMYAPTVRKAMGEGIVFTCEHSPDDKYSVAWMPSGESYKGTVTVNGDSWTIPDGDNVAPDDLKALQCGFFYFGVGGGFELVIYDSGPNGFAAIYRVTPGKGIEKLAWLYTGAE